MVKIKITADNPALQELASSLTSLKTKGLLPATETAFQHGAKLIAGSWRGYGAKKTDVPGVEPMKNPSHSYVSGVKIKKSSTTEYTITNESKSAATIEYGMKGYDMKKTHPYGTRSRVSKQKNPRTKMIERVPYLIVPFKWGTPNTVTFHNTMTKSIHQIVATMKKSIVKEETHFEDNWANIPQERNEYNWGDRLQDGTLGNANGMVRMHDSSNNRSTYFTFRIISARSPKSSWIHKGIPARNVTQGLQKMHSQEITQAIQEGLKTDLNN